jgi:hypothetical protein
MEYKNIEVTIRPGKEVMCSYEMIDDEKLKQNFRVTCEEKNLHLDEDLVSIDGNMPSDWRAPVVAKLRTLIKATEYPDGP